MENESQGDVTKLLAKIAKGDAAASEEFVAVLYRELHRMAGRKMKRQRVDHTLQPTALVNELWAKISALDETPNWPSRNHFYKWASKVMGNLLLDHARKKGSQKAGGNHIHISLEGTDLVPGENSEEGIVDILDAIQELSRVNERLGSVVELRSFGGLSYNEIGVVLSLSESQVARSLHMARAWLETRHM